MNQDTQVNYLISPTALLIIEKTGNSTHFRVLYDDEAIYGWGEEIDSSDLKNIDACEPLNLSGLHYQVSFETDDPYYRRQITEEIYLKWEEIKNQATK